MHILVSICVFILIGVSTALGDSDNSWDKNALKSTAIAQPYQEIELAPQQSGILKIVEVEEGALVRKGQVLARLDSRILQGSLRIAIARAKNKGNFLAVKAERDFAQKKLDRILELNKGNQIRPQEIEKARSELTLAEAHYLAVKEESNIYKLEALKIKSQIQQYTITSPFDGVVRRVLRKIGENVAPTRPLFIVVQINRLKIVSHIPFEISSHLKLNDQVEVEFSQKKEKTKGKVSFIDPVVETASGTVRVTVVVDNEERKLPTGTRCYLFWMKLKK